MKHKLEFEKKVGLELMSMVPQKTVNAEKTKEWAAFIKLLVPRKKVKVTFEWED